MQMKVLDSEGNPVETMEEWEPLVRRSHWKERRSAYSLADFMLNRNGAAHLESRISSVLAQTVRLKQGTPEYAAKFDQYGGPARLDIGISGQTDSGKSLFVGLEAKVDEPFGSETVCERHQEAIEYLNRNPRSKAALRVKGLISQYFADTDEPCESKFADVGYQLLTSTAGTVAAKKDASIFYVAVFKTHLYDEEKGKENYRDYENFMTQAGGKLLTRGSDGIPVYKITLAGRQLICIYEYFDIES